MDDYWENDGGVLRGAGELTTVNVKNVKEIACADLKVNGLFRVHDSPDLALGAGPRSAKEIEFDATGIAGLALRHLASISRLTLRKCKNLESLDGMPASTAKVVVDQCGITRLSCGYATVPKFNVKNCAKLRSLAGGPQADTYMAVNCGLRGLDLADLAVQKLLVQECVRLREITCSATQTYKSLGLQRFTLDRIDLTRLQVQECLVRDVRLATLRGLPRAGTLYVADYAPGFLWSLRAQETVFLDFQRTVIQARAKRGSLFRRKLELVAAGRKAVATL